MLLKTIWVLEGVGLANAAAAGSNSSDPETPVFEANSSDDGAK
jgi:hypothetical protein